MVNPEAPGMQAAPTRKLHTFMVQHKLEDGTLVEGQFTTKKLSIREFTAVTVRKVQMNGGCHWDEKHPGQGIDEQTDYTNHIMATLEMCLVQKPMWFDLNTLEDLDLLIKVYRECMDFENSFSPQRKAAVSVGGSQAGSGAASTGTGAAGSVAMVGRGQVSPSLEP